MSTGNVRLSIKGTRRSAAVALALLVACAEAQAGEGSEQQFPDVVKVAVRPAGPDRFNFDVTVSSPYDTPRRYADGFRVYGRDQQVFGERKLLHDHQHEQPFTRDLYDVRIPPTVKRVSVQARDQRFGYGGKSIDVQLPGR